jgi:hypothetical protein
MQGEGCITYIEAYETTGSATASVTFVDGSANNGLVITDYTLASNQSTSDAPDLHQLWFREGIYVVLNSGSAAGSVTVWADHNCAEWLLTEHYAYKAQGLEATAQLAGLV